MTAARPGCVTGAPGPEVERELALDIVRRGLSPCRSPRRRRAHLGRRRRRVGRLRHRARRWSTSCSPRWSCRWAARISLRHPHGRRPCSASSSASAWSRAVLFAVRNAAWVDLLALGLTLVVTHLGLLFWETRYVSASLAFPGLKPTAAKESVDA